MRDMTRGTFAVGTDDSFTKQQMNLTDEMTEVSKQLVKPVYTRFLAAQSACPELF